MTASEHERVHTSASATFSDTVTFIFADPQQELYGMARLALSPPHDARARNASAIAVLFRSDELQTSVVAQQLAVRADSDWDAFTLAGVAMTTPAPLDWWSVAFVDDTASVAVELVFESVGPPAALAEDHPAARAQALQGYEQVCRAQGQATIRGSKYPIACYGQRSHTWGDTDLADGHPQHVGIWLDDETGLVLRSIEAPDGGEQSTEPVWAAALDAREAAVAHEARLSMGPEDGRPRCIDVELRMDEGDRPTRATGATIATCELDLISSRLELTFLAWQVGGRRGVGYHEALRRS